MSWSISFIGKPANVVEALKKEGEKMIGESKVEFDECLPSLITLVESNYNKNKEYEGAIQLIANGHAYALNGEKQYGTCNVSLSAAPGFLV